MTDRYDVIVIGAGHNGLVTAGLLARGGRRVLVVEQRDLVGGLAASEPFHNGVSGVGVLHDTSTICHELVAGLSLAKHGLALEASPPSVTVPLPDREPLVLHRDPERAAGAIAQHASRDADQYLRFLRFIERYRPLLLSMLHDIPPDVMGTSIRGLMSLARKGLAFRRLGARDGAELARIAPMSVADWLNEWFETDALKAALAEPALRGGFAGPRSPATAFNLLVYEARHGAAVKGGAPALVAALERAATSHGVELRPGTRVERVRVKDGRVAGVSLGDGEELDASVVAASCDVRRLFTRMLEGVALGATVSQRAQNFRMRGLMAKVNLALRAPLSIGERGGFVRTARDLVEMERAFDAVKYGRWSDVPFLDVFVPDTPTDADTATVASVVVHFAPHALDGGWDDDARQRLGEHVVDTLDRSIPGTRDAIVGIEVRSPADLARRYGLTGGHVYHGEHALDQMLVRPFPECARYRTPIAGLYLCGSSAFPGGGLTCAPGALAARVIAREV